MLKPGSSDTDGSADPAHEIIAALAKLRARRMPRPPWGSGEPHGRGSRSDGGRRGAHGHADGAHGRPSDGWGGSSARFGGPARLRLLEALAGTSDPLTVGEIAEAIGVDQPRASRLVQQSVDMDLVRREADPEDARRTRIVLTDAGSELVRGFRGQRRGAVTSALSQFSEQERADLARLLSKFAEAWPEH